MLVDWAIVTIVPAVSAFHDGGIDLVILPSVGVHFNRLKLSDDDESSGMLCRRLLLRVSYVP